MSEVQVYLLPPKNKQTKKKRVSFLKSTLLLMLFVEISMSQVHLGIAKIEDRRDENSC